MVKTILTILLLFVSSLTIHAQLTGAHITHPPRHLRVSLITCGPGDDIWEVFGHTCIRVIDSNRTDSFHDAVFNYGTFDYHHANFFIKVVNGTLPYFLSVVPFSFFKKMYIDRGRSMYEEEFLLGADQKERILSFLETNNLPQNREYKYDFLVDNCSIRIRDVFPKVLGNKFVFGNAMPANAKITYRDISDQYAFRKPLERFGVYIFLGSTMDKSIDNNEIMFIPDYLSKALETATIDGRPVGAPRIQILPGYDPAPDKVNEAFLCCFFIAVITIVPLSVKKWRKVGKAISNGMLMLTGIIGCIIVFFWFGTDHLCAHDNFNSLWAMPLNLTVPFLGAKWKGRYSLLAICLIGVSLLLHLFRVQVITLVELSPLLFALLFIHGNNYRESKIVLSQSAL